MSSIEPVDKGPSTKLRGRDRRFLNLSTKLTEIEAKQIEDAASRTSRTPSEWMREILLREAKEIHPNLDLVSEIVGLQLLVMNVLAPLARGERITAEQFQAIVRSVQSTKVKAAQEMLARRRELKEV
jgi:hypothetical protein